MKTALSIFFLTIFSIQVLPVKEVGKLLFKQQLTEEVKEFSCDDSTETEEEAELKMGNDFTNSYFAQLYPSTNILSGSILLSSQNYIFRQYIADTPTPPPNCKQLS